MARIRWMLAVLSVWFAVASAYSAQTFCKCTCFTNSTIIPLGPQHQPSSSDGSSPPPPPPPPLSPLFVPRDGKTLLTPRASTASCTQCNRAFCLDYHLPICKDAAEKDVVALCFQRDSRKDQLIVWGFLLGTGALLGWAAVRRVLERRAAAAAAAGAGARTGDPRAPLLSGGGGVGAAGSGNVAQRIAARLGFGSRTISSGGGGGLRSARSPLADGTRGQYAPLDGAGGD
ncbi:hypothetical protein SPI_01915 [Niveomyces insectorum RCEF 264]|uniref:Integral membrane protein n=1 Tax=Niveomyces insectorum RCEF 264 TaxID=1081102 RepID=A0A167ZCA1_9HYPO|nr:hypothetical protein SPI_01915 [Niveomyces insectorum RCEF 264]